MSENSRVNVMIEDTSRSAINRRVLSSVVDAIEFEIEDPASVDLVVAGNMTKSCRLRMPPELASQFSATRGSGSIAGKTFTNGDRHTVVLAAERFVRSRQQLVTRLAHHEALHVVLHKEGEDPGTFVIPEAHRMVPHNPLYPVAVNFWGEFRIERALSERENLRAADVDEPTVERARAVLLELPGLMNDALMQSTWVSRARGTLDAFDRLIVALSYLAGVQVSGNPEDLGDLDSSPYWLKFVGESWSDLVSIAQTIPPADQRQPRGQGLATYLELTKTLHEMYRRTGFEFQVVGDTIDWLEYAPSDS